jgi:hypothetical protein
MYVLFSSRHYSASHNCTALRNTALWRFTNHHVKKLKMTRGSWNKIWNLTELNGNPGLVQAAEYYDKNHPS